MEVARFFKSNLKLFIFILSITQSVLISYLCFVLISLTLKDFIQLIPAVTLAIWILPCVYSSYLRLSFSFNELKIMLKAEESCLMITERQLDKEIKSAKFKLGYFYMFTSLFIFAEAAYIYKIVL